jgi:hypothetical protein
MHDPLVVAFEIRRPWPRRSGRGYYWPSFITVWHREPHGRDSGEVCKHYRRILRGWRWHVHHWHIQVHPWQHFRRWTLTRCAWCGGKSRKDDPVNHSHSWDGPRGRWWQGAPGRYHQDCSSIQRAHQPACLCEAPILTDDRWGVCARCGERRYGRTAMQAEADRILASIPHGQRDRTKHEQACAVFARERAAADA